MWNKPFRGRPGRAVLAVAAALALAGAAAPLSAALSTTAADAAEAQGGGRDQLLPTPEVPRISDGPYAGFQLCGSAAGNPVATSGSPTLAATLESVAPPGTVETPNSDGPRRKVVFEVDEADGKQVVRKQLTSDTSHDAAYQLPEGKLTNGEYRWRVRVMDGATVSEWTAWCDFTVKRS
ncbi:hypothetical protein [Streptomyces sp. ISL-86]|uniref:hypothetical protein n=1 Tax=Streptomyces sp. ISL-86 TaxID=2819187 RepID=UPI001BE5A2C5|nr:hypothetical protein [Streptomyces sp. ISL-86]MBT2459588.1 hypothetical protein [Streptomyces sp. ISL-86]